MNNLLVIIFNDASQASRGDLVLRELAAQHQLTVYSASSVSRARDGDIEIRDLKHNNTFDVIHNPLAYGAVGLLFGLLGTPFGVGLFTASVGAVAGAVGGGFMEWMRDFVKTGGREELADEISLYLQPHMVALIADVEESETFAIDSRMKEVGGKVFRQPRTDAGYSLVERELVSLGRELTALRAEEAATLREEKAVIMCDEEAALTCEAEAAEIRAHWKRCATSSTIKSSAPKNSKRQRAALPSSKKTRSKLRSPPRVACINGTCDEVWWKCGPTTPNETAI